MDPQSFVEDPLRVLRIAQFIARFEMTVEEKTLDLCYQMVQQGMLKRESMANIVRF